MDDAAGLAIALEEAKLSYNEGGIPIGAALVSKDGTILGQGHNMRVQLGSPIHHVVTLLPLLWRIMPLHFFNFSNIILPNEFQGETSALYNSGRLPASAYAGSTMYTTLSPCDMCTGACLLYGISRVVIGENRTFLGGEAYLKQRAVEVIVVDSKECHELMTQFITEKPDLWNEDIGVTERVHSKEAATKTT
ncbi:hypothetical protein OQA88_3889 [Cercophora sp. LCS_1]